MKTYQNNNAGFAPLGALIAGLIALGVIGGGAAVYKYSKQSQGNTQTAQNQQMRGHGAGAAGHGNNDFIPNYEQELSKYAMGELDENELEGLLYMREEEKLARDVYIKLYEKWGTQIFNNISNSEERHALAVKALLDRYGIEDPVIDDSVGVFQNSELKDLYVQLVEQGSSSLEEALKVGALIEDLDIKDLEDAIARTDNEDIRAVYENLMRGSRNHLRSFTKELNNLGVTYTPQYISQAEYEDIINSEMERGQGHGDTQNQNMHKGSAGHQGGTQMQGQGRGRGHGQGMGQGQGQGRGYGRGMMQQ